MGPRFSPDGEAVLFTWPRGKTLGQQTWDFWSAPVSGGKPTLVRRHAAGGSLSPDARTIAYIQVLRTGSVLFGDLWLADADGADARPLVRSELAAARWSPDGTRIAYADEGRGGTYTVDVGTDETTRVLDDPSWPEWLDDHTLIFDVD
jgi:Tol biopolymer transport system component